ncbi:MAG: hypothetical protein HOO91_09305 [Bacteroidales bacterium]|nr:hypothetical protein [Bacteroidales bacterium]
MSDSKLKQIINDPANPLCLRVATIGKVGVKATYISIEYLQTHRYRLSTYPKPVSKIINI